MAANVDAWIECHNCTVAASLREDYRPGMTLHVASGKCSSCDVLRCPSCHAPVQDIRVWICPSCKRPVK